MPSLISNSAAPILASYGKFPSSRPCFLLILEELEHFSLLVLDIFLPVACFFGSLLTGKFGVRLREHVTIYPQST